jgi:hypothetical protein
VIPFGQKIACFIPSLNGSDLNLSALGAYMYLWRTTTNAAEIKTNGAAEARAEIRPNLLSAAVAAHKILLPGPT